MTLLRLLVAAALTFYVLRKSQPGLVLDVTRHADLRFLAAASVLVFFDRALMAWRWVQLLCTLPGGTRPPFRALMRVFFVSTFVGTFLPASIGGDAVRAYALRRESVAGADAVASVFMDRVLGALSILIMAVAGVGWHRGLATDPLVVASLGAALAGCAVVAAVVFSARAATVARAMVSAFPGARVRQIGARVLDAVQRYSLHRGMLAVVLLGSIAVQVLRIVQAWLLGRGLGIAAPPGVYFALIPIILLVMLLPITINGIGTSQAAFVWFFAAAGVGRPEAFALSVLFVALGVVGNLPGGVLYAARGLRSGHRPLTTGP